MLEPAPKGDKRRATGSTPSKKIFSSPPTRLVICMHPNAEGFLAPYLAPYLPWLYWSSGWWTILGFVAGFTFSGRFILQWFYSERAKKVVVPPLFWHLSFWGSLMNMIYLMHLDHAPLIFANCFLPFLYGRNLYLLYWHPERREVEKVSR